MKLYHLNEQTGEYTPATRKQLHAACMAAARLRAVLPIITSPSSFVQHLQLIMASNPIESFYVYFLDNSNKIIGEKKMSEGQEDQTSVYPRRILQETLERNATGILVAHNHPSGTSSPSNADIRITKAITDACEALDIRFLDHIIIAGTGYTSFREQGMI